MPTLVVDLSHQGQPELRLQPLEPLGSNRTRPDQPPMEADRNPPRTRVDSHPPPARAESLLPLSRVGSHPLPTRAVNRPPQAEVRYQPPQEVLPILPQVGEERVIVPRLTGTK